MAWINKIQRKIFWQISSSSLNEIKQNTFFFHRVPINKDVCASKLLVYFWNFGAHERNDNWLKLTQSSLVREMQKSRKFTHFPCIRPKSRHFQYMENKCYFHLKWQFFLFTVFSFSLRLIEHKLVNDDHKRWSDAKRNINFNKITIHTSANPDVCSVNESDYEPY